MAKRTPRRWTPEKIKEVLDYRKEHTYRETMEHFDISSGQLHGWVNKLPPGYYSKKRKAKANGAANGLLPAQDALKWLETWRQAYFDRMKAETPSAASVLAALRGGK